ncbi:hypothetical protein KFK09_007097 [Dendrobium nobile]|uniref:Uncharacterized protein n=1 Tax=Dendrobium nobile TaxID=94219 RepID=A0A8T3BVV7_DENNO|nr:hypothetical protein KFK09_007097 [Dendrobium nobile]
MKCTYSSFYTNMYENPLSEIGFFFSHPYLHRLSIFQNKKGVLKGKIEKSFL